jgi:hypothetical protein
MAATHRTIPPSLSQPSEGQLLRIRLRQLGLPVRVTRSERLRTFPRAVRRG